MNARSKRIPGLGFIAVVLLCIFAIGNQALGTTISLQDIDSGLTSPTGNYRWLDVADQLYSEPYRAIYNYTPANVYVTYDPLSNTLHGTLTATKLKPNFAYQLKLVGTPDTPTNEHIGLTGRWWQEERSGSEWINGQNLNLDRGDGSSPNANDLVYFAHRDDDQYRYTGYLVFDYFITNFNKIAGMCCNSICN